METVSTTTVLVSYSDGTSSANTFAGDAGHAYAAEQRFWMTRDALHVDRPRRITNVTIR